MPMFSDDGKFNPKALATLAKSYVELQLLPQEPDMAKLYTEAFLPGEGDRLKASDAGLLDTRHSDEACRPRAAVYQQRAEHVALRRAPLPSRPVRRKRRNFRSTCARSNGRAGSPGTCVTSRSCRAAPAATVTRAGQVRG